MNKYVSRGLWTVLVTGGFMALGIGAANADTGTSGEDGIASGTQGILGIELPIQLGGNAISVLGDASSDGASSSAPSSPAAAPSGSTDGGGSVAGGSQVLADLGVPIQLGGNAISVLGDASSSGSDTAPAGSGGTAAAPAGSTDGEDGVLSGTQVLADLGLPVTLGGNAISVLGDASRARRPSGCADGASTASGPTAAGDQEGSTSGSDGVLGGTQLLAELGIPVTLGGNAISVLGDASTGGSGTTTTTGSDPADPEPVDSGDPGDTGTDLATAALEVSAVDDSALADTGADGNLTALAMAVLLLMAGAALVSRRAITRRH